MDNNGYRLLLPEGTLDYFIISDVKESASEIVIYLEEKNEVPKEYAGMKVESKGFYEPVVVQDFPIRGKKLFLNVRRRRWVVKDENRYVSRSCPHPRREHAIRYSLLLSESDYYSGFPLKKAVRQVPALQKSWLQYPMYRYRYAGLYPYSLPADRI